MFNFIEDGFVQFAIKTINLTNFLKPENYRLAEEIIDVVNFQEGVEIREPVKLRTIGFDVLVNDIKQRYFITLHIPINRENSIITYCCSMLNITEIKHV